MEKFSAIYQRACKRKGGEAELAALLPAVRSPRSLARLADHRALAEMTRCVFQAGFVWRVVDAKWDDFEQVFFGFPPERIVLLSPDQIDRICLDPRIIRNRQKVLSIQQNARFLLELAEEHGNFGRYIGRWPSTELVALMAELRKRGSRLGGMSGQRVLRNLGRDTFITTGDVVRCLQRAGLDISDSPTGKRELQRVQEAFNRWHDESGLPYSHLSRICACAL